jgi:hypothetical protein
LYQIISFRATKAAGKITYTQLRLKCTTHPVSPSDTSWKRQRAWHETSMAASGASIAIWHSMKGNEGGEKVLRVQKTF